MAITTPPTLTDAPTSPDRSDPSTFTARAIALDNWTKLNNVPELRLMLTNVFSNATDAASSGALASASQIAAAASATVAQGLTGVSVWVSGTTYAIGDPRYSPVNQRVYRRKTAGAGTTDPSLDSTNWGIVDSDLITQVVNTATATIDAGISVVIAYAGACALTLPANPANNDRIRITVANNRTDASFDIGAKTLTDRAGTLSGIVTMNTKGSIGMKYIDNTIMWVRIT